MYIWDLTDERMDGSKYLLTILSSLQILFVYIYDIYTFNEKIDN